MSVTIVYGVPDYASNKLTPYRSLVRLTRPVVEPVTLTEAKAHCRIDASDDDAYVQALIAAAREYVEDRFDTTLLTTTWQARYDCFPLWQLVLPRMPMLDATVTITYRNEGGTMVTMTSADSAFQVDHRTVPGRVYPLYNGVWPAVRGDENSVMVQWSAGYGDGADALPQTIKHLCLLLVANWYASREPVTAGLTAQNAKVPYLFETLAASVSWGLYR